MSKGKYLNSVEAANILGVNVSTIKRWTDSGKLNCIQTAGGHRKFLMKHINEYLKSQPNQPKKITAIPYDTSEHRQLNHLIQKHDVIELHLHLLNNALKSHRDNVNLIINGLVLAQYPLHKIFDELVTPVLHKIGELWEYNHISVAEEHIASNIIRDAIIQIRDMIVPPEKDETKSLCIAFSDDLHDMAIKMVQLILEQRGHEVIYSGQSTPAEGLKKIITNFKPNRIYISCVYYNQDWSEQKIVEKNRELQFIYNLAELNNIDVFIGGMAFNYLSHESEALKGRLFTFAEVYKN